MAIISKLTTKKKDFKPKEYKDFIGELTKNKVTVGIHKGSGQNVVNHAVWNEFGVDYILPYTYEFKRKGADGKFINVVMPKGKEFKIPPRPFVRLNFYPDVLKNISEHYALTLNLTEQTGLKYPKNKSKKVLESVAKFSENQMKSIATGMYSNYEQNAALTIAIKGFDRPLFRTGQMINHIKGKVDKR